ncbi:MAG: hypothetical protein JJT94_15665 [Bernardetiaceae bacterium]|nr:hypothetical protein [Bernardetiaceae bacterium]
MKQFILIAVLVVLLTVPLLPPVSLSQNQQDYDNDCFTEMGDNQVRYSFDGEPNNFKNMQISICYGHQTRR